MTGVRERSVKVETEEVIANVIKNSLPAKVTIQQRDEHKPGDMRIILCLKDTKYRLGDKWQTLKKDEAILLPLKARPEFSEDSEVLIVKIRKMVVVISKSFSMPTTLLCSEDRYKDFSIHADCKRILDAVGEEACLLVKIIFYSIQKLIELNNSGILNSTYAKFLSAMSFIGDNLEKNLNRVEVANSLDICSDYLNTLFKKYHGLSFSQYIISRKMEYSRDLLKSGMRISEVANSLAYNSDVHFSSLFKKTYGLSPKKVQLLMLKKRALTFSEREKLFNRVGFTILKELPASEEERLGKLTPALRSAQVDLTPQKNYVIILENTTDKKVEVFWLDEKGSRISHGFIAPGKRMESSTQSNRVWIMASAEKTVVFLTPMSNATALF